MHFSFRILIAMFVAIGAAVGISFGLGVAYGHGNAPKAASSCCTPQQLQTLTGITVAGGGTGAASATTGGGSGTAGGGTQGATGGSGVQRATAAGSAATGAITALDGQTLTIESRTGPIKVNLSPATKISKLTTGSAADLAVGSTVVIAGTRKDDGSYDATQIDQAPSELASLIGGGAAGGASATPAAGR